MGSLSDHIAKLRQEIATFNDREQKALSFASIDTNVKMYRRIFNAGRAADGSTIGRYSTKPTLSNGKTEKSDIIGRKLASSKAKRSELNWVTIKGKHLFEIPGGYKEIRELEGLQSQRVDLTFSAQLNKNFAVPPKQFGDKRIKELTPFNSLKATSNEKRFGKSIFKLSKNERLFFREKFMKEFAK